MRRQNFIDSFISPPFSFLVNNLYSRPKQIALLLIDRRFLQSPSYYPEKERKSKIRILWENLIRTWKHCRIEEFYFAYGLDVKGTNASLYVDYSEFMHWRDSLNKQKGKPFEYTGLLRDKFVFNIFASGLGFPASPMIGMIENGVVFILENKKYMSLEAYLSGEALNIFCKGIDAEDGRSIYHIETGEKEIILNNKKITYPELAATLGKVKWTIEHRIIQHQDYALFYPKSVNTLRIYTVRDVRTGKIQFLPSIFRVGDRGNNVDNWARGGLIIRLFEDGSLGKYGYYRPKYGTKTDRHPETGVIFEGKRLPWVEESFELVKKMHSYLYGIHSIGWDVAVTENGPLIIEANDNWEISATQIPSFGCQEELNMYFKGRPSSKQQKSC